MDLPKEDNMAETHEKKWEEEYIDQLEKLGKIKFKHERLSVEELNEWLRKLSR